MAQVRTE